MKKIIISLCVIFLLIPGAKAQIDSTLAVQLQNVLNNKVTSGGHHGVSAHLIMANGHTWSGTAGVGKQNIPITDTTLFHGASTTKMNIAILMMMLAEDSLIDLDDSWHKYVSLNVAFDTLITIRQLLNHTSGIADYLETAITPTNITSDFNHFYTPQYILENIVSPTPVYPAGTHFSYSTSNYVLAGLIIEAVTGNPVQTELRNRIWNPLGMHHTYFGAYETYTEPTAGVWDNFGSGLTDYSNMPTTSMLSYGYGGANIVTCPTDLALLDRALLTNQLLNAQSMNEMLTFVPTSFSGWTKGYGLGIHHYAYFNDTILGHDGAYTNFSDMFHSKKFGFTLVTMSNTDIGQFSVFYPMLVTVVNYFNTVGIAEYENKIDLKIYPNPTKDQFNVTSSQVIDEINITDMYGRVFYLVNPNKQDVSFTMANDGMYFMTIKSGNQITTRKLIVER